MPTIKVDIEKIKQLESQLDRLPGKIGNAATTVNSVRNKLDWDIACEQSIDRKLRDIAGRLDRCYTRMQQTVIFLGNAAEQYSQVETDNAEIFNASLPQARNGSAQKISNNIQGLDNTIIEDRKKTATAWKLGVGIGMAILGTAIIIATGGVATPLVLGGVGALSGVITSATNHLADEYVETGKLGTTDWSEFGKDVVVGGIVGFASGCLGGSVGNSVAKGLSNGVLSSGLSSANTAIRVGSKAVIGAVKDVSSGIVSRGSASLIEGIADGQSDVIDTAIYNAVSPVNIVSDFVGGISGEIVTEVEETALLTRLYSANAGKRVGTNAAIGAGSQLVEGVFSRGSENVMQEAAKGEFSLSKVVRDAFNPVEMFSDVVEGGATRGIASIREDGLSQGMSKKDTERYKQFQSGYYNVYNTELVVADQDYINQNAMDAENYGRIKWKEYAPNGGSVEGTVKENQTIKKGTELVRWGNGEGSYLALAGTDFDELSLPYKENPKAMHKYVVLESIDNVTESIAAPAFGKSGGGTQYVAKDKNGQNLSVYNLMLSGKLMEVRAHE